MSADERRPGAARRLMPLPRVEDLPAAKHGVDPAAVEEAFRRFELYAGSLRGQLRELQEARARQLAAGGTALPGGETVTRAEAIELARAAAAFAETLERDARESAQRLIAAAEEEARRHAGELAARRAEVERGESELDARREAFVEEARRAGEAETARIVAEARRQAADIVLEARAEAEHRLEWARAQAAGLLRRAQQGADERRPATLAG
jgi:hypothetical protein